MSRGVIIFKLLALISSIVFSNFGSGSIFAASVLLFILSCSKLSSKDAGILEICFSCTSNCYGKLTGISLITSVDYERHSVSELIGASYFSICLYSLCCCSVKSINSFSFCSIIDQIYQTWPGVWSQSNIQKMKFQK